MREIKGYVFIAGTNLELMFGKPKSSYCKIHQNIETNGLTPFETIKKAKNAAKSFSFHSEFSYISLGRLYMKIAETKEELFFFRKKTNLIVIMKDYDDMSKTDNLFGPLLDEKTQSAHPLPGAWLGHNGYHPYKRKKEINQSPFERAMYQLSEINRQSGCAATIAQFRLRRLEELFKK